MKTIETKKMSIYAGFLNKDGWQFAIVLDKYFGYKTYFSLSFYRVYIEFHFYKNPRAFFKDGDL